MKQWRYVPSKLNTADHLSPGLGIADAEGQTFTWTHGPKILWQKENTRPNQDSYDICKKDPVAKYFLRTNLTSSRITTFDSTERISSWSKMKRLVAIMFIFKDTLPEIIKPNKINVTGQLVDMNVAKK